jgi:hypothetical protein
MSEMNAWLGRPGDVIGMTSGSKAAVTARSAVVCFNAVVRPDLGEMSRPLAKGA